MCRQRETPDHDPANHAVMDESWQCDLKPARLVTYACQALVGSDLDITLCGTFDKGPHYRAQNLGLDENDTGMALFHPEWRILEINVNERISYWSTEQVASHNLNRVRMSKNCHSIELGTITELLSYLQLLCLFTCQAHPLDHALPVTTDGVIVFHHDLHPAAARDFQVAAQSSSQPFRVHCTHRQVGRVRF
jgi:hypothetical protein